MRYVILGTAGHIDHGKSALVRAMTGIDPDRLKEEKERGITIDLGFAYLSYPDGLKVGIVDVPGHERLIKNMLAGAGGTDLVLMVIAADEGIMPQSREHLSICDLLKIKKGLIVINKTDLVETDWLELVTKDVKDFVKGTFLQDAEIIQVSSKTGAGIDLLKEKIREIAIGVEPKPVDGIFRLPVDRVFTLKGFGTVISGTAVSGSISVNDHVEILPRGIRSKVRGLQSHGEAIKTAYAGQRVAVNLQGIEKEEIRRGDVLTAQGKVIPTSVIDARIELLKDVPFTSLKNRSLVHFHTGTSELVGRIIMYDKDELKPGESAFGQFRLMHPLAVMAGDRYVIRRFSPLLTIGGGEILDTSPRRRKRKDGYSDLEVFEQGGLEEKALMKIYHAGIAGLALSDLEGWVSAGLNEIERVTGTLVRKGEAVQVDDRLVSRQAFEDFSGRIISVIKEFHLKNPLRPGMLKEELRSVYKWLDQRLFEGLLSRVGGIAIEKEIVRLESFKIALGLDKKGVKAKILKHLEGSEFQPPANEDLAKAVSVTGKELSELLKLMASEGIVVRINDAVYLPASSYSKMIERLKGFFAKKKEMTVGEFRDILGTSRKFALPFLEYLDSNRITIRVGDVRKLLLK
ncbi:MAG TPA: selenocysteine-specific translation elongation factor [Nitrospirae bacterium]|nr:selenocysteine-specific translation elongation factor [Nitrospirota bacterium]